MVHTSSISRKIFIVFNTVFLVLLSLACMLPFVYLFSLSLSSKTAAAMGLVTLWPVDFTVKSYQFVMQKPEFFNAFSISLQRVALGVLVNMSVTVLTAYPLSKEKNALRLRTAYVWFFVFTMLFSGGMVPSYMVVRNVGLLNSIWALVLPGALPVFNMILLLNFFRGLPKELEEAAFLDGAGHWSIMARICVPLAKPALATVLLFVVVGHWNTWFDGMIYMQSQSKYPLSTYLQSIIILPKQLLSGRAAASMLAFISEKTIKAAQIFICAVPVLLIYPFLQKYFMTGLVLGSVKE